MADARKTAFDLVDGIGAVGSMLARHPLSAAVLLLEATFLAAGLGVFPDAVARVLGFPTYPVHVLLVAAGGGVWWRGLATVLVATLLLEVMVRRVTGGRGSAAA